MSGFRIGNVKKASFLTPQEMYDDYKDRKIDGIHDYQSKTIDAYLEASLTQKDIALELPTGTGKTLVGLLIAEFNRKKYNRKVLYLCPNNQLVNQTAEQAKNKYGINVVSFTGKAKYYSPQDKIAYTMGNAVAVTNYSSLFNINPFFKDPDILIFDDAHAGENFISSNWSCSISRDSDLNLYYIILNLFKDIVDKSILRKLVNDNPSVDDKSWCDMLPNIKVIHLIDSLIDNISNYCNNHNTKITYSWRQIKSNLEACNIFLSWKEIVIRPLIPPTMLLKPFAEAQQRIYMSATPGKSGELERAFGISRIHRIPAQKKWDNKAIGRRFFMFPSASFEEEKNAEILKQILNIAGRALMIVNSNKDAEVISEFVKEALDRDIFFGSDIETGKQGFLDTNKGIAIVASRFDGIDFLNDECRMLILYDLPNATHIQEKFFITRMSAATLYDERIKTRIVQAIGRCSRSITDYAAVCVFGDELMNSLLSPKRLASFNAELQAELEFGQENSVDLKNINDMTRLLDIFFNDRNQWKDAEEYILSLRENIVSDTEIGDDNQKAYIALMESSELEVKFQYELWRQNYLEGYKLAEIISVKLGGDKLKGYRGFWQYMSSYCAYMLYLLGDESYKQRFKKKLVDASKSTISVKWFSKLLVEIDKELVEEVDYMVEHVIENIELTILRARKKPYSKFQDKLKNIINGLKSEDGRKFEKAHYDLGVLFGFKAINQEGDGDPDPIWIIGDMICIVSEDKIFESCEKVISITNVRQAATHRNWIKNHLDVLGIDESTEIISVLISNSKAIDDNARQHGEEVCYFSRDELIMFGSKLVELMKDIWTTFSEAGDIEWREKVIERMIQDEITPLDYIKAISRKKVSKL
jgi:Rad3-related DNA helicase